MNVAIPRTDAGSDVCSWARIGAAAAPRLVLVVVLVLEVAVRSATPDLTDLALRALTAAAGADPG